LSSLSSLKHLRHVSKHQNMELEVYSLPSLEQYVEPVHPFLTLSLKMNGRCSGDVRTGAVLRQLDNNTYGRVYVEWPEASDAAMNDGSGRRRMESAAAYMYAWALGELW
jgi:hypothetical protein